jgi:hypothetical protein
MDGGHGSACLPPRLPLGCHFRTTSRHSSSIMASGDVGLSVSVDISSNSLGSARVNLRHLQFSRRREPDEKNITRLGKLFGTGEGCDRFKKEHHIPAVIDNEVLDSALKRSRLSRADLIAPVPPTLVLSNTRKLTCLCGWHRAEAVKRVLDPIDLWWTVDLYDSGR